MHYHECRKLQTAGPVLPCDKSELIVVVHDCANHERKIPNVEVELYSKANDVTLGEYKDLKGKSQTDDEGACLFKLDTGSDGYLKVHGMGLRTVEGLLPYYFLRLHQQIREREQRIIHIYMIDNKAAAPADFETTVDAFLEKIERIRTYVDFSANLGHQSAAIAMVARLREIGYTKPIEFLASTILNSESATSMAKILTLRPDFFESQDLRVTKGEAGSDGFAALAANSTIGMVAAYDGNISDFQTFRKEKLKVTSALFLQPYNWTVGARGICTEKTAKTACLPSTSTYQYEVEVENDLWDNTDEQNGQADLRALYEGVRKNKDKDLDLIVVYGLAMVRPIKDESLLSDSASASSGRVLGVPGPAAPSKEDGPHPAEHILKNLLYGILTAQRCRRTVMLLVHKDDKLDNIQMANVERTIVGLKKVQASIATLSIGNILLVRAPPLSQKLFQQFCLQSTLPVVLEGANTTNLLHMMGKPYFSVNSKHTPYPDDIAEILRPVEDAVNAPYGQLDAESVRTISEFLVACRSGEYDPQFLAVKEFAKSSGNDQVKMGLYVLAKQLDAVETGIEEDQDTYATAADVNALSAKLREALREKLNPKPKSASSSSQRYNSSSDDEKEIPGSLFD